MKGFLPIALFFTLCQGFAQQPIDVTDQTIKIGGGKEEVMYFGFAEGDQILFNFREIDGKEVKEVEILEFPNQSRFSDFKTSQIQGKTLQVHKQGAYIFRFKNGAINGRICKITIQRIPATEATKSFNTSVTWETKQETTYETYTKNVVVGYDTTYFQKKERVLVSEEKREELVIEKNERVHSQLNENGNKSSVFFTLPQNQETEYTTSKVVTWAYWVGVGEEANRAWQSNAQTISSFTKAAATYFTTPLGALAIGAAVDLALPKLGEDVGYGITDIPNRNLFLSGSQYRTFDYGKGVAGFKKFDNPLLCQGTFAVCLYNDNTITGIDVTVKVIAIVEKKVYEDKTTPIPIVTPRYEPKTFSEPVIKSYKIPVVGAN